MWPLSHGQVDRLQGTHRLLIHGRVNPNQPGDLESMDELKERWKVSAWKTYTQWGVDGKGFFLSDDIGTRFIATEEANADEAYKRGIVDSSAADVVYTPYFTGVHGNYLRSSIVAQGLDPETLPLRDKTSMNFGSGRTKAWRDIWGVGQGIGSIDEVLPVSAVVKRMVGEYEAARRSLGLDAVNRRD